MTTADRVIRRGVDEPALAALAAMLAPLVRDGGVILLSGELGAGKTTFARALLGAFGVRQRVKSPTYSLIESYSLGDLAVHHLDLYRIADAGELEWLGLADLVAEPHLMLVEWPERAGAALPAADLVIALVHAGAARDVEFAATSPQGQRWLNALASVSANGSAS
jgi:tRNA threonylcarbamoyladenosine biosynthesis protein TsaE